MVSLVHNIQDGFWQPADTDNYDLSILVGVDRLCYCITDASKKLLGLRSYKLDNQSIMEAVPAVMAQDSWLGLSFRNTYLAVHTKFVKTLPYPDFNPELDYFTEVKSGLSQFHQPLYFAQKMQVAGLPAPIVELLRGRFRVDTLLEAGASLLSYWNGCLLSKENPKVCYLHLQPNRLQLAAFSDELLVDYQPRPYQSTSDILYWLLHFYQQQGYNPDQEPLYISGELVEDSEIYKILYKYVRNIHFLPSNERLIVEKPFDSVPAHFFADLFAVASL